MSDISINGVYFEIPLFKITSQEYELITPITAKQLSFEELEYLNIDKGLDIILELTKPEELNGNFQVISLYLNYIAQMRELYKKEKIAWLLVNNLVLERVLEMRKIYNEMRNIILEVIREFSPKGATAEDILPHFEFIEILMQFAETVGAFEDFFKHIDESAEKEESISFDIVDEWNTKFQAMTESSTLIYIYWSSVILDKHLQS